VDHTATRSEAGGRRPPDQSLKARPTCWFTFTQDSAFSVLGSESSGAFAGASGPGGVRVYFGAFEPRYASGKDKGRCDGNANPLAKGAVASFLASAVLTVKQ
jgi:hypothetical protein